MQKITPFLWFNDNAEEAMNFYTSVFKDSKIVSVRRWGKGGPGPEGAVMTGTFEIEGQQFYVMNGGPIFKFTEAISLFINCPTQEEVDFLWERLSENGQKSQCGWLKDQFGLSWQIVPQVLGELMSDKDPAKVQRVVQAMMQMTKLDSVKLKAAAEEIK